MQKLLWFVSGMLIGLTVLSISKAAVHPQGNMPGRVTDDTVLYQRLREIQVPKHGKLDFDGDIRRLSEMEKHHRERLPSLRASKRGYR